MGKWSVDQISSELGISPRVHTKMFASPKEFYTELYYYSLIRGQGIKGFVPIIGGGEIDGYLYLIYAGNKLPPNFYIDQTMNRDLIAALEWLSKNKYYYVNKSKESLFWDPERKQVALADYQFFDPTQADTFEITETIEGSVKEFIEGKSNPLFGSVVDYIVQHLLGDTTMKYSIHDYDGKVLIKPPLTITEFIDTLSTLHHDKFENENVFQNDEITLVQTPPNKCVSTSTPFYPFIGKIIERKGQLLSELRSSRIADLIDPDGKYHARLVKTCQVDEVRSGSTQLIYEYTGQNLSKIIGKLNQENRIWFYKGLKNLMEGIMLFHENNFTHADIKPQNITWDQFFNLKLIDFGIAHRVDNVDLDFSGPWTYLSYPVEMKMVYSPNIDVGKLYNMHLDTQEHEGTRDLRQRFVKASGETYKAFIDHWALIRQLRRNMVPLLSRETDMYGLAISLMLVITDDIFEELLPVLQPLVSYTERRNLKKSLDQLNQLIDKVEKEIEQEHKAEEERKKEEERKRLEELKKNRKNMVLPEGFVFATDFGDSDEDEDEEDFEQE